MDRRGSRPVDMNYMVAAGRNVLLLILEHPLGHATPVAVVSGDVQLREFGDRGSRLPSRQQCLAAGLVCDGESKPILDRERPSKERNA